MAVRPIHLDKALVIGVPKMTKLLTLILSNKWYLDHLRDPFDLLERSKDPTNRHHDVIITMVVLFSKCDSQMILQSVSLDTGYWAWLVRISPNVCSRCREDSAQTPRGIRWGLIEEEFKSTCFGGEIYASCPQPTEAEERCESKTERDFTAEAMLDEVVQRRGTESSAWQRNLRREKWRCFAEVKIFSMKKSYVPVFFLVFLWNKTL